LARPAVVGWREHMPPSKGIPAITNANFCAAVETAFTKWESLQNASLFVPNVFARSHTAAIISLPGPGFGGNHSQLIEVVSVGCAGFVRTRSARASKRACSRSCCQRVPKRRRPIIGNAVANGRSPVRPGSSVAPPAAGAIAISRRRSEFAKKHCQQAAGAGRARRRAKGQKISKTESGISKTESGRETRKE
jgi:hypothetical protein